MARGTAGLASCEVNQNGCGAAPCPRCYAVATRNSTPLFVVVTLLLRRFVSEAIDSGAMTLAVVALALAALGLFGFSLLHVAFPFVYKGFASILGQQLSKVPRFETAEEAANARLGKGSLSLWPLPFGLGPCQHDPSPMMLQPDGFASLGFTTSAHAQENREQNESAWIRKAASTA